MNAYLITWDESDGNDCTVFDTVIEAATEDIALNMLADALERTMNGNGTEYQEDGNMLGYLFNCSEDCDSECCDGHGGIGLRTVERYDTEKQARDNMARYHSEYSI